MRIATGSVMQLTAIVLDSIINPRDEQTAQQATSRAPITQKE